MGYYLKKVDDVLDKSNSPKAFTGKFEQFSNLSFGKRMIVTEKGELSSTHLFNYIREKFKELFNQSSQANKELIELSLLRLIEFGAEREWINRSNLSRIKTTALKAGLLNQSDFSTSYKMKSESSKTAIHKMIDLLSKEIKPSNRMRIAHNQEAGQKILQEFCQKNLNKLQILPKNLQEALGVNQILSQTFPSTAPDLSKMSIKAKGIQEKAKSHQEEAPPAINALKAYKVLDASKQPTNVEEFLSDLSDQRLKIEPAEDILEAYFYALMGRDPEENDLVEDWIENQILANLSLGLDERQETQIKQLFDSFRRMIGIDNAFVILSRCYQLILTLKEEHSIVTLTGHRLKNMEQLIKIQLSKLVSQKPEFLAINLTELKFNKKLVRKSFIDALKKKKERMARWLLLSFIARKTLFAVAIVITGYKLYQNFYATKDAAPTIRGLISDGPHVNETVNPIINIPVHIIKPISPPLLSDIPGSLLSKEKLTPLLPKNTDIQFPQMPLKQHSESDQNSNDVSSSNSVRGMQSDKEQLIEHIQKIKTKIHMEKKDPEIYPQKLNKEEPYNFHTKPQTSPKGINFIVGTITALAASLFYAMYKALNKSESDSIGSDYHFVAFSPDSSFTGSSNNSSSNSGSTAPLPPSAVPDTTNKETDSFIVPFLIPQTTGENISGVTTFHNKFEVVSTPSTRIEESPKSHFKTNQAEYLDPVTEEKIKALNNIIKTGAEADLEEIFTIFKESQEMMCTSPKETSQEIEKGLSIAYRVMIKKLNQAIVLKKISTLNEVSESASLISRWKKDVPLNENSIDNAKWLLLQIKEKEEKGDLEVLTELTPENLAVRFIELRSLFCEIRTRFKDIVYASIFVKEKMEQTANHRLMEECADIIYWKLYLSYLDKFLESYQRKMNQIRENLEVRSLYGSPDWLI